MIDIVLTTHVRNILQSFVCKSGLRDHDIIGVIRKLNCTKYAPRKLFARNYKQYSVSSLKNELRGQNWDSVTRNNDFNTTWNGFKTITANTTNKHAPLVEKTVRGRDCPWLTREIKQKMYQRDYQLRKAKRTKNPEDWSHYRKLRNLTTYAIRKEKANYERSIFNENESNPKNVWKQIKKCYPIKNKSTSNTSFKVENKVIKDKNKISNAFCVYFSNIPSLIKTTICNFMSPTWQYNEMDGLSIKVNPNNYAFSSAEVHYQEVLKILESLYPYKPAGVDNIPPKVFKDAATEIAKPLLILANRSLQCSQFPMQ